MNKIEINGHTEIYYTGKRCTYVIGAIFDGNYEYVMSWLSFTKDHGRQNEKVVDTWDNIEYLKNLHENVIKSWVKNKEIKDSGEFSNFLKEEYVDLQDFEGIDKLFDRAFNLGLL